MTGEQLIALGHAAMARSHQLILLGGGLGLLSIVAGLISRRIGAPVLLVFLAIGIWRDDHLLRRQSTIQWAYLIGSVALAVILLEGGLKTPVSMLRLAFWPAAVLATIGVGVTAGILGAAVSLIDGVPVAAALLAGAAAAPTDAAAVAVLLRRAGAALPERLFALLGVESGLNDPMSVFLTFLLIHLIAEPGSVGVGGAVLLFLGEMGGGAALGVAGGWVLAQSLKRLPIEGLARSGPGADRWARRVRAGSTDRHQRLLATYLLLVITGATQHRARAGDWSTSSKAWPGLAQIVLIPDARSAGDAVKSAALYAGCRHRRRRADPAGSLVGRVSLSAAVQVQPA
jgi:hypothetical protein